jgi:hypothetical protein
MRIKRLFDRNQKVSPGRTTTASLASLGVFTLAALAMLSITAADQVSAQASQAGTQQNSAATSPTNQHPRPDMNCTFWVQKEQVSLSHPGLCEGSKDSAIFFLQAD